MEKKPLISQDMAERRIMDALHLRVGRGRRYSFASLSEATGIPERTLRSYVDGTTPPLHAFLSLGAVLGPGFVSDILAEIGQTASDIEAQAPDHMKVLTAGCGFVAMLSDAMADGKVDHREAAQLRELAAEFGRMVESLARVETGAVPFKRGLS
jgi:hypothetical protein